MYVYLNIEARSCNRCCLAEAISMTYSEGVFVALRFQQAFRMRHIVIFGFTIFFHIIS
jgi:hypothetical protein